MEPEIDPVAALKEVPGCTLRIFGIARKAIKPDGSLDTDMLTENYKEVREAADEAEAYAQETANALADLKSLLRGT
jgi:hypothetical protein